MSKTDVFEWFIMILVCILSTIYLRSYMRTTFIKEPVSIASIAKKDLHYVGTYNHTTTISVKYWVLSLEAAVYFANSSCNLIDTLRKWNKEYNYDPDNLILEGIESAHTDFLFILDKSREENTEPKFKISQQYDYHNYPLSFQYNDYINPNQLLQEVDRIIGGD